MAESGALSGHPRCGTLKEKPLVEQVSEPAVQRLSNPFNNSDRRVLHLALNAADVGPIESSFSSQRLPRSAALVAKSIHTVCETAADN